MDNKIKKDHKSKLVILEEIKQAITRGERTISVEGRLTRKQIAFLKKKTGAEIKDVTLFFQAPSRLKRREYCECADFISRMEEAALSISPFEPVFCLKEDGGIGVELIKYPTFIVIYDKNFLIRKEKLSLFKRFKRTKVTKPRQTGHRQ